MRFDSFFCFSLRSFWRFQARDSGNRAIRDSRFCAAKQVSLAARRCIKEVNGLMWPFCRPPVPSSTEPIHAGKNCLRELLWAYIRVAPFRFGPVTVRWWNGLSGSGFRFPRFLCKKGFPVFQYSLTAKDGSGSGFGSWKTVPAVPVPLSVSGKTVPTVPVSGSVPGPP